MVPSRVFADPRIFIRDFSAVVAPPLISALVGFGRAADLAAVRCIPAGSAGPGRIGNEMGPAAPGRGRRGATNALVHGALPRRLWVYTEGPMPVRHVQAGGPGFADPLAAYPRRPARDSMVTGSGWAARPRLPRAATDATGTHVRPLTKLPEAGSRRPPAG